MSQELSSAEINYTVAFQSTQNVVLSFQNLEYQTPGIPKHFKLQASCVSLLCSESRVEISVSSLGLNDVELEYSLSKFFDKGKDGLFWSKGSVLLTLLSLSLLEPARRNSRVLLLTSQTCSLTPGASARGPAVLPDLQSRALPSRRSSEPGV